MNAENQKKILDAASQMFTDVAKALGKDSFSYEESVNFIRDHGNTTIFGLLFMILKKTAPLIHQEQNLSPEAIPGFLGAMDTWDKAAAFLVIFPDPDPKKLDRILDELSSFLLSIRKILVSFTGKLPPDPGGHPVKIEKHEEQKVLAEITQLFNDGWRFPEAKREVARRRGASASTIQRICRKWGLTLEVLIADLRSRIS